MPRGLDWLLPERPDVLEILRRQAAITIEGMTALSAWAHGDATASDIVREAEHRADAVKRELRLALRESFITPIGQEDLYILSERLDAVLSSAKDAVREAEVMAIPPDEATMQMTDLLALGVGHVAVAFERLEAHSQDPATDAADAATKAARGIEKVYRRAMSDLLEVDDLRTVMGRRELYRRFSRIAESLQEVSERVWYAAVKEA